MRFVRPTADTTQPPTILPQYAQSTPGEFGRRYLFDGQVGIDEDGCPPTGAGGELPTLLQPGGHRGMLLKGSTELLGGPTERIVSL